VGVELARFATDVRGGIDLATLCCTAPVSVVTNMALGLLIGLAVHHLASAVLRMGRRDNREALG
jgi:hypothetical protein